MFELILIAIFVSFLASFAQAVTGFGFALVAVPLLALFVGVNSAVVAATCLSAVLTVGASLRYRLLVDWSVARTLTVAALVGMPLGLLALIKLDPKWLTLAVAVLVLLFAAVTLRRIRVSTDTLPVLAAGFVGGMFLTSTGMNGPPIVAALQAMDFSPHKFRATLQASFAAQDIFAVLGFSLVGQLNADTGVIIVAGILSVLVGWIVGGYVFARVSARWFRILILLTLVGSAITLIFQAIQE